MNTDRTPSVAPTPSVRDHTVEQKECDKTPQNRHKTHKHRSAVHDSLTTIDCAGGADDL